MPRSKGTKGSKGAPKKTDLDRREIERAMRNTSSNKQAARYLGVPYYRYARFAKLYKGDDGVSLFDKHKNEAGKGIPKMSMRKSYNGGIIDILEGRISPTFFSFKKIKERIIIEGLLEEKCNRCGFHEKRVLDYKVPLILSYKDGNKRNLKLDNIEFLCYNCYFLTIADLFDKQQIDRMENYAAEKNTAREIDLELPESSKPDKVSKDTQGKYEEYMQDPINTKIEQEEDYTPDYLKDDYGDELISFNKFK